MNKLIDHYNFWLPCQGTDGVDGAPHDALGIIGAVGLGGNLTSTGLLNTEVWNNAGFATTKNVVDGHFFVYGSELAGLPKNNGASDNQNVSVILSYALVGVSLANTICIGSAGAAGTDLENHADGIGVRVDTTGDGRLNIWSNSGGATVTAHTGTGYSHATNEHHHFIAVDGVRNSAFMAVNGVWKDNDQYTAADISGAVLTGNRVGEGLQFGGVGAVTCQALRFKDIKFLVFDGMLPVNLNEIMRNFYLQPMQSHKNMRVAR